MMRGESCSVERTVIFLKIVFHLFLKIAFYLFLMFFVLFYFIIFIYSFFPSFYSILLDKVRFFFVMLLRTIIIY